MPLPSWSRKVMLVNSAFLYPLILLGGYILYTKSLMLFSFYLLIWAGILTIGRYYVCRRCPYYGQDCPSFSFGHLARVFRRDENARFSARACMIDIAAIGASLLLPPLAWVLSFFEIVGDFSVAEHVLIGLYIMLAIAMVIVHEITGCSKCEIAECPTSKAAKARKRTVVKS